MNKIKEIIESNLNTVLMIGGAFIICIIVIVVIIMMNGDGKLLVFSSYDSKEFKDDYEQYNDKISEDGKKYPKVDVANNNKVKYSTVEEIVELFENKEDVVIYFGEATCLYCRTAVQILFDIVEKSDLDIVYYLPVTDDTDYSDILKYLDKEMIKNKKEITIPMVAFVVNGDVVSFWEGTVFSQKTPYDELDKYQIEGISEIYQYGIRDVLRGIEDKKKAKELMD